MTPRICCLAVGFITVAVMMAGAGDVPRSYSAVDNEPLTGNADLIKSGSGALWLTAPSNNTFSGDIRIERSGGTLELGGNTLYADGEGRAGISLPMMTSDNLISVNPGATLLIKDNANGAVGYLSNRFGSEGERPSLELHNSSFTYQGPNLAGIATQSFGVISAKSGLSTITVTRNNAANTTILQGGSFTRDSGSHLTLSATAMGTAADNVSQILFTTPPAMVGDNVGVVPGLRNGNNWVTYDEYGLRALLAAEYLETDDINSAGADDNVKVAAGTFVALGGDRTINSLMLMLKKNWAMGAGNKLTIKSGQVLLTQDCTVSQGLLTAGAGGDTDLNLVPTAGTLTISGDIVDNGGGKVRLVKSGAGTVTLSGADNAYSGGTVALEGTLQTSGTTANRRFFGSGPVLINGGYIILSAIGSTANADGPDYTVINVGQVTVADAAYTEDDTFHIGAGSLIYGPSSAGRGLNSLERGVNITLEPGAVVSHAAMTAPFDPDTGTIRNLGTAADLFYGVNAAQANPTGRLTIGAGTPFKGITSTRGSRAWEQGTLEVAAGATDIYLQGLELDRLGATPTTLTLGNGTVAGGPVISLATPGTVTAHIRGYVVLDDDSAVYGDTSVGKKVNFVVGSGAQLTAARANCMGSGDGVASITVAAGGTLLTSTTVANNPWDAYNGDVTVEAGGRLVVNVAGGLTGAGHLTLKSGAILHITNVDGFSGSQAANAVVEPGVIVRVAANLGSANESPNTHLHDKAVIWEIFGANRVAVYPQDINTPIMTLERSPEGRGGLLTNDEINRSMTTIYSGYIGIGSRGGAIAATRHTTLTVSQQFALGNNALTIGYPANLDWVSEPKLGTVTLSAPAYASTSGASGRINVLPGASLRNAANSLPTMATLNVDGDFYAAGANTIGALEGTGLVNVASALTFGLNNANTTFAGRLEGGAALGKVGSGKLTLTGFSSNYTGGITVGGGELALVDQGTLNTSAVTLETGGILHLDNSLNHLPNRFIEDGANVTFNGGTLRLSGKANTDTTAIFAQPNFNYNTSTIEINNGANSATELRFNSNIASVTPNGTLNIVANNGTLGSAGNNPRLFMAGLPAGLIGFASVGGAPAWYDSASGFRAFSFEEGTEFDGTAIQTTLDTVFTANNIYPVMNDSRIVNSLWIDSPGSGKFIDLSQSGNYGLTITSGRLNLTGNDDFEIRRSVGSGVLTWTTANLYLNIANPATTLTVSAPLPASKTVRKDGPGTLEVNNVVSSALSLNNGTVKYGADGDFNNSAVTIYGGQLDLTGKTDTFGTTTIYNGGITNSDTVAENTLAVGALTMGSGPAGSRASIDVGQKTTLQMGGNFTYNVVNNPKPPYINAKEIVLGATRTFTINDSLAPEADIDLALDVPVSGSATHGISKAGAGVMSLGGANTFDGNISVAAGLLIMNHPQAFGLPSANRTVTVSQNAMLLLDGSKGNIDVPANFTSFNIRNAGQSLPQQMRGALISRNGTNSVSAAITLSDSTWITAQSGKLVLNGDFVNTTVRALTVFTEGNLDINGTIGNKAVSTLAKYSGGRLTMRGSSGHTGVTHIYGGALNVQHNNALGTTASGTVVYNTAALELQGNVTIDKEALTIEGTGSDNDGALRSVSGTNTYGGTVTLSTRDSRINCDSGLLKLAPATGNSVASTALNVIFGGNGDIEVANPIALTSGSLTKDGNGTLTLKAANTFTGPTIVKSGRLTLDGSLAAKSTVTVASGAFFDGTGHAQGTVTMRSGATLAPGAFGVAGGNLTTGSLLLENNSLTVLEFDPGNVNDTVTITDANGLAIQSGAKVALYNKGTTTPLTTLGTYSLFQYNGALDGSLDNLVMHDPASIVLYTFFADDGWIKVNVEAAKLMTLDISNLTPSSATLRGIVYDLAAEAPHLWFCLDREDKGTTATSSWKRVHYAGKYSKDEVIEFTATGLESGSNFVYRLYGENSAGIAWSTNLTSFTTIYLPTVVNRGARVVAPGTTEMSGEVTDIGSEVPHVWFHYWQVGSTTTNIIDAGLQSGPCKVEATELPLGIDYQFKLVAANQAGESESAVASFSSATIYHVRNGGSNTNDGLSWSTAMESIQAAIDAAKDGDMILVAGGTYLTQAQIELTKSDFTLLGGYADNGYDPDQRDPRQWPTIIIRDESEIHRVMIVSNVVNALLDGFTLSNGETDEAAAGAGIMISDCTNLLVRNVIIENNRAGDAGATINGAGAYVINSTITTFSNVAFRANQIGPFARAAQGGGAAVIGGSTVFDDCLFLNNQLRSSGTQTLLGAGLYLSDATVTLRHTVIINNGTLSSTLANGRGDGLYIAGAASEVTAFNLLFSGNFNDGIYQAAGNLRLTNATLIGHGNIALRLVGGTMTAANIILWQNMTDTAGTITLTDSLVDTDPLFERGLYLRPTSPAVDAATATAAELELQYRTTQITFESDEDVADLGYHFSLNSDFSFADDAIRFDPLRADIYVASDSDPEGTGSTEAPFATIAQALAVASAGSHIHLAGGAYTNGVETLPVVLDKPGLKLLGAGRETTIIDGCSLSTSRRIVELHGLTGDSEISGLTISGAKMPSSPPSSTLSEVPHNHFHLHYGGGMKLLNSTVRLSGMAVTNNTINGGSNDNTAGAGVYSLYGWVTMTNSLIFGNTLYRSSASTRGTGYGGGLFINGGFWSIQDSLIVSNKANLGALGGNSGGGIYMIGAPHHIADTTIACNLAGGQNARAQYGAGIYMNNGLVERCIIKGNYSSTSTGSGGGVFISGGTLRNSLITDNQVSNNGGAVYASGGLIDSVTAAYNYSTAVGSVAGIHLSGSAPVVSNSIIFFGATGFAV